MALKCDFDSKYNIINDKTPQNAPLSGHYKMSYAYHTLRSRLPVILTDVIDYMTKDKQEITAQFGKKSYDEIKLVIELVARLRAALQTDRPFNVFKEQEPDAKQWNEFISELKEDDSNTYYKSVLLHAECYVYRRLYSFFESSIYLRDFDCFNKLKRQTLANSLGDICELTHYTRRLERKFEVFEELLKIDLWSNRNDLSMYKNMMSNQKVLDNIAAEDDYILVNNASEIWKCLSRRPKHRNQQVDIVCDNAGYELFADFILAEYMIEKGLATKVRFHVKAHPWFVSDITKNDFQNMLQFLCKSKEYIISLVGKKFSRFLEERKFELAPISRFWTGPHAFYCMRKVENDLYRTLARSKLIIFKGDLNYRKLLGDVAWETTQELRTCVRGFMPTNFCILCAMKAEVVCGLPKGLENELTRKEPNWMISGKYGVMQFVDSSKPFGY